MNHLHPAALPPLHSLYFMRLGILACFAALMTSLILASAASAQTFRGGVKGAEDKYMVRLRRAVDQRDPTNIILQEVVRTKTVKGLALTGMLSDVRLCTKLAVFAAGDDTALTLAALKGLSFCRLQTSHDDLIELIKTERVSGETLSEALLALSYHATKEDLPLIFSHYGHSQKRIKALIQAVAYNAPTVAELGPVDWSTTRVHMLDRAHQNATLYMLGRIEGIESVIKFDRLKRSFQLAGYEEDADAATLALRLMARYGEAEPLFSKIIADNSACPAGSAHAPGGMIMRQQQAVLRFAPTYDGERWKRAVARALESACPQLQSAALSYSAQREADIDYNAFAGSEYPEIAMIAMTALHRKDPDTMRTQLVDLLVGDDYFKAYSALSLLAESESGQAAISANIKAVKFPVLATDADYILNPGDVIRATKKRSGYSRLLAWKKTTAVLETSKGQVTIALDKRSYAAANFRDLIQAGRLDGMIWHRVIGNFVAQAGQTPKNFAGSKYGERWPLIRDEWEGAHRLGTLGVATDGKDTGSSQFFINTNYNQHLDGRYTVFGTVIDGMDVVHQLMQGDVILSAKIVTEPI